MRATLALLALLLGYLSCAQALGFALRKGAPEIAHALAPSDGRVTAALAEKLSSPAATAADRPRADRLARLALRQDPTAVGAAAALGLNTLVRGNTVGARRMFRYAETLSRRSLQTQLWAIEDAVARDDIPAALNHYDIALRTQRTAQDLLFPVLASAITDPAIRAALIRTLADEPSWSGPFLDYVAANGRDPRATATLFLGLRRAGEHVPDSASATMVSLLVARNFLDEAWTYYSALHPDVVRRQSRDPKFAVGPRVPSPLDWMLVNDGGVTSSLQSGPTGALVEFSAPAGVGGRLLQQMQLLPPGTYHLEGHSAGIDQPESSRPYWALYCGSGRELGRVEMPNSAERNGRFTGRFRVPADCPMQMLALVARPTDAVAGLEGEIDFVRLSPDADGT